MTQSAINAGEYDYDESEELPAGCSYVDSKALVQPHVLDSANVTNNTSPAPVNALATAPAPANLRRLKAFEMSLAAVSSDVAATTQMDVMLEGGDSGRKLAAVAPALAPMKTPKNATLAAAKKAAMIEGPGDNLGNSTILVQMLCKPVPARIDPSTQPVSHKRAGPPWWDILYYCMFAINMCLVALYCTCGILNCRDSRRHQAIRDWTRMEVRDVGDTMTASLNSSKHD